LGSEEGDATQLRSEDGGYVFILAVEVDRSLRCGEELTRCGGKKVARMFRVKGRGGGELNSGCVSRESGQAQTG
jgi:hypothetical protein